LAFGQICIARLTQYRPGRSGARLLQDNVQQLNASRFKEPASVRLNRHTNAESPLAAVAQESAGNCQLRGATRIPHAIAPASN